MKTNNNEPMVNLIIEHGKGETMAFVRHISRHYLASDGFSELSPTIRARNAKMILDLVEDSLRLELEEV